MKSSVRLKLFIFSSFFNFLSCANNEVIIGLLVPSKAPIDLFIYNESAMLALTDNKPEKVDVSLKLESTKNCDTTIAAGKTSELIYRSNVTAIIGPSCAESCDAALRLTTYTKKLLISYRCTEVEAQSTHPYFIRTRPFARADGLQITRVVNLLATSFNWKIIGIIFSTGESWSILSNVVTDNLRENGIEVIRFAIQAYTSYGSLLQDVKQKARILLVFCSVRQTVDILKQANAMGIQSSMEYATFIIDFDEHTAESLLPNDDEKYILQGVLNLRAKLILDYNYPRYKEFVNLINTRLLNKYTAAEIDAVEEEHLEHLMVSSAYLYDAILVYLANIDKQINQQYNVHLQSYLLRNNFTDFFDLNNLTYDEFINLNEDNRTMWVYPGNNTNNTFPVVNYTIINSTFNAEGAIHDVKTMYKTILTTDTYGYTDRLHFQQENGNRQPSLIMTNILYNKTITLHTGNWTADVNFKALNITWLGGNTTAPPDTPKCGFEGVCVEEDNTIVLIVCLVIIGVVLMLVVAYKVLKMQKYENDVQNKESILKFSDIKTNVLLNVNSTTEEIIEKKGTFNAVTATRKIQAVYNNKPVMLKKLPKKDVIMTREIMIELKHLRDLKHANINRILGVTGRSPNITIIQEYSKKGSLYDILNNEDIQLDWVFKHTFLWDIVNGMCAIHDSPIKIHGNLTSKNCLITHRWIVQVADFGLREFKRNHTNIKTEAEHDQLKYEALLWTAPENINFPKKETRSGDVYSFAILTSEIINRQPPFSAFDDMRPSDVIHYIRKRCIPPFRPHVTLQTGLDARLLDMMKNCWSEWTEDRPTFKEIKPIMKQIRGEGIEIIDNMIDMMERYSRDLDKTARERTEMFKKEKMKSNELLYRCVPKPIVTRILEGDVIEPYEIESLILCIVKIGNLKELESRLSSEQMIDVMNDYYKMTTNSSDVYEDIYELTSDREELVYCSHTPGEVDDKQVSGLDMAHFALQIIKGRARFRWRHIDVEDIKLKVTLHSGSAKGIVIGNKVPVYSLIGDTIDFARLLTQYTPQEKIVVTDECFQILKDEEDLVFEEIGLVKCQNVGVIEPKYLVLSETLGEAFPVIPEEIPEEEIPETARTEEGPGTERDYSPPVAQYWDVASVIETAFEQWFHSQKAGKVVEYNIPPIVINPK